MQSYLSGIHDIISTESNCSSKILQLVSIVSRRKSSGLGDDSVWRFFRSCSVTERLWERVRGWLYHWQPMMTHCRWLYQTFISNLSLVQLVASSLLKSDLHCRVNRQSACWPVLARIFQLLYNKKFQCFNISSSFGLFARQLCWLSLPSLNKI